VKKKYPVTSKDKKDWITFTKRSEKIYNKDDAFVKQNTIISKTKRLDLHGLSLNQANKIVKKFIIESFEYGYKKLLIITGKGLRSKVHQNPYLSEQMNVLKHSVPKFIKNDEDLFEKIKRISIADLKDGGEGAFYVFLKK
jgi:DNA-nicking Smr family endonuclease